MFRRPKLDGGYCEWQSDAAVMNIRRAASFALDGLEWGPQANQMPPVSYILV